MALGIWRNYMFIRVVRLPDFFEIFENVVCGIAIYFVL